MRVDDIRFEKGTEIETISSEKVVVDGVIHNGGRATIYECTFQGRKCCLRWYKELSDWTRQIREDMLTKIFVKPFNSSFLWPLMVTRIFEDSYGYITELYDSTSYFNLSEFQLGQKEFVSEEAKLNACKNIAQAFADLHKAGYCYNYFDTYALYINPENGDIVLSDIEQIKRINDKGTFTGVTRLKAPEMNVDEAKNEEERTLVPNIFTDRFSLALVLFMLLLKNHPFEGEKFAKSPVMSQKDGLEAYGSNPQFIFDGNYKSMMFTNKALYEAWTSLDVRIKSLFIRTFSKDALARGVNDRPLEEEWIVVFSR